MLYNKLKMLVTMRGLSFIEATKGQIVVKKIQLNIITIFLVLTAQLAFADNRTRAVQERLLELGFTPGIADGIWGKKTETALQEFLSAKGLTFDGKVDSNELELLGIRKVREEKIFLKLNIDNSLPQAWASEFNDILEILRDVLPIDENFNRYVRNSTLEVYAWSSKVKNPFSAKPNMGGACICGDGYGRYMVLEINQNEFKDNSLHRYSVIVHEYFHAYQIGLSNDRMNPKWLVEGGAKVMEEMFVQQYYRKNSLAGDLKQSALWSDDVFKSPNLYEKHETSSKETSIGWMDMNYAGSAFMTLALVNELQKKNISEEKAFELVFRSFWTENAKQSSWKSAFEKTFNMTVETFYSRLAKYRRSDARKILPSNSLKIQNIFN